MRWLKVAAACVLLFGCRGTADAPQTDAGQVADARAAVHAVDAAPSPDRRPPARPEDATPAADAAEMDTKPAPDPQGVDAGEGEESADTTARLMARERRRYFERQERVFPPGSLPGHVRALVPPALQHKIIAVQVHRQMNQSAPRPGRARYMLRWLTLTRGEQLRTALNERLRTQGWRRVEAGRWVHPTHGEMSLELREPDQRPSRVEMVVTHEKDRPPLGKPTELLDEPPAWLTDLPTPPLGYEFGHYHARGPGATFTDLQRLALTLRPADPKALVRQLRARALEAGYEVDADTPDLLRRDGRTMATQILDGGYVIVHHQRRWQR